MNALRLVRRRLMRALMRWWMDSLGCWLHRRGFRRLRRTADPALLELEQFRYCLKLGPQLLEPRFMLGPYLLHELLELSLVGIDLLFKQAGTVLQVPSYVTHFACPSLTDFASTPERAGRLHARPLEPCRPPHSATD